MRLPWLVVVPPLALLTACPTGGNNNNNNNNNMMVEELPPPCDLDNKTGLVGSQGPTTATTTATSCTKDFECSFGQMCVASKCAVTADPDKLQAELTIPAAGNYVVSLYWPADKLAEAGVPDEVSPLTFEFQTARRDELRVYRPKLPELPMDPALTALLTAKIKMEAGMRARERLALQDPKSFYHAPSESGGGAVRQTTCTADQYKHKGTCYSVGQDLPPLKFSAGANANVITTVKKVVGKTAILLDKDNSSVAQADIDKLAEAFDTIAGPRDRLFFNKGEDHSGTLLDVDGNGMLGIVLSGRAGTAGTVGLFDVRDVLAMGTSLGPDAANGNQTDIMWAQPPGLMATINGVAKTPTVDLVAGTLAHEYQHMINLARARAIMVNGMPKVEETFLNEALSHLAEDLTGYGSSNLAVINAYLHDSSKAGLRVDIDGINGDNQNGWMRGIGYLYLRYLFDAQKGFKIADDGKITDQGGIAFVEKLMATQKFGIEALAEAGGSTYSRMPLFFATLVTSQNNADASLLKDDCRFNYPLPGTDPQTKQATGIKLNDPGRKDASGTGGLLDGYLQVCAQADAEGGSCKMYATGGFSFIWENAKANDIVRVKADSGFNLRLSAVKVK
ncbi:MAG: hypothetical protein IT381_24355 [Deltaproteobacteria bacterium]|nr:hypothetical protein [Deltaproteobacteria bacterium]